MDPLLVDILVRVVFVVPCAYLVKVVLQQLDGEIDFRDSLKAMALAMMVTVVLPIDRLNNLAGFATHCFLVYRWSSADSVGSVIGACFVARLLIVAGVVVVASIFGGAA